MSANSNAQRLVVATDAEALVERALNSELTHHLGYEKHDPGGDNSGKSRNVNLTNTLRMPG